MRRFTIVLAVFVLLATCARLSAQVICYYEMAVSTHNYTASPALVSVLPQDKSADFNGLVFDDKGAQSTALDGSGFNIGFDFKYNNQIFTRFALAANGYVVLGKAEGISFSVPSSYSIDNVLSSYSNVFGVVLGCELGRSDSTEVGYELAGEAGNRVLTIEYRNLDVVSWGSVTATVTVQYRLYEATGNIDFAFNHFAPSPDSYFRPQTVKIGLAGNPGDVLLKDGYFDDDAVSSNAYGVSWSSYSYPADGLTYTWSAPKSCETPTAQPSGLQLESSSNAVKGSFTAQAEGDHFLVLIDRAETLGRMPADGTTYAAGDSIGTARVIGYLTDGASFATASDLSGATAYHVYVMAANSSCLGGPKYNKVSPLTGTVSTQPEAPAEITVTAVDSTAVQFAVQPNSSNDPVLVAMTDRYAVSGSGSTLSDPQFGTPEGDYAVGDRIAGGGTVVYKGPAKDFNTLDGLKKNTVCHLKAWTVGSDGRYSTTAAVASTRTAATMPWNPALASCPLQTAPAGWSFGGGKWVVARDNSWGSTDTAPYLEATDVKCDGGQVSEAWAELPDVYLARTANRLIFALQMNEYVGYTKQPLALGDSDELLVQLTTDGQNYTTVQTLGKADMPAAGSVDDYKKHYVTFYEAAGSKVRMRLLLRLRSAHESVTIRLRDLALEEKGSCDYPVNVTVPDTSIVGGEATVAWQSQGEEDAWEIWYKKSGDTSWTKTGAVRTNPYKLTGLDGLTGYVAQVRALCSETEHSKWSEKVTFKSGLAVPFTEDFTAEKAEPAGWKAKAGELGSPSVLTDGGNWKFNAGYWSASVIYTTYDTDGNGWYISPLFDLGDGSASYDAFFEIESGYSRAESTALYLVVAKDGKDFYANDTVMVLKDDAVATGTYKASLLGYTGKVRLGLLFVNEGGSYSNLSLKNVGVQYGLPTAISAPLSDLSVTAEGGLLRLAGASGLTVCSVQVYDAAGRLLQQSAPVVQGQPLRLPLRARGNVMVRVNTTEGSKVLHLNVR